MCSAINSPTIISRLAEKVTHLDKSVTKSMQEKYWGCGQCVSAEPSALYTVDFITNIGECSARMPEFHEPLYA